MEQDRDLSPRFLARLAGLLQLLEGLTSTFGQVIVREKLFVSGNAAATAAKTGHQKRQHRPQLRIAGRLIQQHRDPGHHQYARDEAGWPVAAHSAHQKAGHGAGKPTAKLIEESADELAFLVHTLNARSTVEP